MPDSGDKSAPAGGHETLGGVQSVVVPEHPNSPIYQCKQEAAQRSGARQQPPQVRESQLTGKQMRQLAEVFDRCIHQPSKPDRPTDVRILIRYGTYDFEGYDQRCTEVNREVEKLAAAAKVQKQ